MVVDLDCHRLNRTRAAGEDDVQADAIRLATRASKLDVGQPALVEADSALKQICASRSIRSFTSSSLSPVTPHCCCSITSGLGVCGMVFAPVQRFVTQADCAHVLRHDRACVGALHKRCGCGGCRATSSRVEVKSTTSRLRSTVSRFGAHGRGAISASAFRIRTDHLPSSPPNAAHLHRHVHLDGGAREKRGE